MRVLLQSQQAADKAFFEEVASRAGLSFQQFTQPVALADDLARDPSALVVVDASSPQLYSAFENCVADKLGLYSAIVNPNYYFFVASVPFHQVPYLHGSQIFGNFVHRNYHQRDQEIMGQIFARFAGDNAFGIEKYFSPMAKLQVTPLTKSSSKIAVVEALKDYCLRWGLNSRAACFVANAADEILMNAIYDAPVDDLGKAKLAAVARNTPLDLEERSAVEFKVIHDDTTLGFSVSDLYGSIDRSKIVAALSKTHQKEEYKLKPNQMGAGLGLIDTYLHSGGMVFAWEPGVRTEVMAFYRKSASFKDFREQLRFLSTFTNAV